MEERKAYLFTIELEVTATSEKEALKFAIEDAVALHEDGSLGYEVKVSEQI